MLFGRTTSTEQNPETESEVIADDPLLEASRKLDGWCSAEKADLLFRLVKESRPETCVEIGIFGGRSIVPIAAALLQNGSGRVFGIETWSPIVATEYVTSEQNDDWWRKVDFPAIKARFIGFLCEHHLTTVIRIVEAPASRAASIFDRIDFLHIDGAHSMMNAAEDVVLYSKLVPSGGIVVFDDVNWPSTQPAVTILSSVCEKLVELRNEKGDVDCVAFRKK